MDEKLNQWLALIDDHDRGLIKMAEEKNMVIKKAKKEIENLDDSPEVRRLEFLRELWEHDRATDIYYAKKERLRKTERKNGIKQNQIRIAKKMLNKGIDIEEIVEMTDLTIEDVKNLKEQIENL